MLIRISPKVDSKSQRRVQCSIPNFENILQEFIKYKSNDEKPNLLRNVLLEKSIKSQVRSRNKK